MLPCSNYSTSIFAALTLALTAAPLAAQEIVIKNDRPASALIELYSSEGCSSCPPAETWLNGLATNPRLWHDLFPVAFHVDYWDSLGWPDRFAQHDFTLRQRTYAARLGQDSIYTPEFIVDGAEWRRSFLDSSHVPAPALAKSGTLTLNVDVGEKVVSALYARANGASDQRLVLNVAVLGMHLVTEVKAGENDGRTLEHDFVVLGLSTATLKAGADKTFASDPVTLSSSTGDKPAAIVAWVTDASGAILQVAGGGLHLASVAAADIH